MGKTNILERLIHYGMIFSMVNCFLMVIITIVDITSRHVLNMPVPGVIELSEVLMVGIVFMGLAMAQKERTHIRAEIFICRFSLAWKKRADFFADLFSTAFWTVLLVQTAPKAWHAFVNGEYREGLIKFPVWPARWAIVIGLFLICLQLASDLFRYLDRNDEFVREVN
jgi:TRAP-type C4-dicarboxylate transport system permease small subunit